MPRSLSPDLLAAPVRSDMLLRLVAEVRRRLARARCEGDQRRRLERVEVEVERCDPLAWLAAQPHGARLYWHGRGEEAVVSGVGAADAIAGNLEQVLPILGTRAEQLPIPQMRYFGGLRFAPGTKPSPEWAAFEGARFVLPRLELTGREEGVVLAVNLVFPRDARRPERVLAEIERVRWPETESVGALPLPVARTDAPGKEMWRRGIDTALRAFETVGLDKVVLARRARYDFDEPLDPFALAQSLERATPSCFHFLIQPAPGVAFLGASPERLFRRDGRMLRSEAVAGTRPRGTSDAADARLREELRLSEKDQREHGFVREQIREALAPFCASLDVEAEASDMMLARGRHLYSGISASLNADVQTLDVLRALHPTPAVGGTPTADALAMIDTVEPFDRGWYAGPIGWVGAEAAEFAVGIRSGLVQQEDGGATLSLYSGAGIVRGSEAEAEWAEIEHKISDFARVLALDT